MTQDREPAPGLEGDTLSQRVRELENERRVWFDNCPVPSWIYELDSLRIVEVNRAAIEAYGWSADQFLTFTIVDLRPPGEVESLHRKLADGLPTHHDAGRWRHRRRDGSVFNVAVESHALTWRGLPARLVYATELRHDQQLIDSLALAERRYTELFEHSRGLICTHDLDGTLRSINPAAAQALGWRPEDIVGRNLAEFIPEASRHLFAGYLRRYQQVESDAGLLHVQTRSGQARIWEYHNRIFRPEGGRPYVLGHAQDVTERRLYERRLREQSMRDPLTGAWNRRHLTQFYGEPDPAQQWACVVVDVDHFKEINDTFGHQRGDETLQFVARLLERQARAADAVVRMGGDQFLLLLDAADTTGAENAATRVRSLAAEGAPCTVSVGIAAREGDEPLEKTIIRAEQALRLHRLAVRGAAQGSSARH